MAGGYFSYQIKVQNMMSSVSSRHCAIAKETIYNEK